MNIIKVNGLTKKYGDFIAVNNISFNVKKGDLLGFLGVNGAGKSTTINMLSTLLEQDSGSAEICGYTLGRDNNAIRRKIGIVYQQNCLDAILTVGENLMCRGIIHGADKASAKKRLAELLETLNLEDILKKPYRNLSGGQKRRCEIASALMHTPEILFLDEPTTGLDPATRKDVWQAVENLRANLGMTVFLTTHYMEEASTASRIIILDKGNICADGTPFQLKEKYAYDLVKLYCIESRKKQISDILSKRGKISESTAYGLKFYIKATTEAIALIYDIREFISGFEVIQGNMDDVFLNACGRNLDMGES